MKWVGRGREGIAGLHGHYTRVWSRIGNGRAMESMRWRRNRKVRSIVRLVDVDLCSSIYPSIPDQQQKYPTVQAE